MNKTVVKFSGLAGLALLLLAALMLLACNNKTAINQEQQAAGLHGPPVERLPILLASNCLDNKIWEYKQSGPGAVLEVTPDDNNDDEFATGCKSFVFTGLKPGEVTIDFRNSDPDNPAAAALDFAFYRLNVLPDKSIAILEFYKEYGDCAGPGNEYAIIVLPATSPDGIAWTYTASQPGIIEQRDPSSLQFEDINDYAQFIPGTHPFLFYGLKAGDVMLNFKRAETSEPGQPLVEQTVCFKIRVFEDKSMFIIGSSLENY